MPTGRCPQYCFSSHPRPQSSHGTLAPRTRIHDEAQTWETMREPSRFLHLSLQAEPSFPRRMVATFRPLHRSPKVEPSLRFPRESVAGRPVNILASATVPGETLHVAKWNGPRSSPALQTTDFLAPRLPRTDRPSLLVVIFVAGFGGGRPRKWKLAPLTDARYRGRDAAMRGGDDGIDQPKPDAKRAIKEVPETSSRAAGVPVGCRSRPSGIAYAGAGYRVCELQVPSHKLQ